jgi:hypothetical protein
MLHPNVSPMGASSIPHASSPQTFTYAARRGPYLSTLGTFLFLCLAEWPLVVLLVIHFVPGLLWQTLVHIISGLSIALLFGRLLLPLWTSHRISEDMLELHYGLDFRASIPRSSLVSATPAREMPGFIPVAHYDAVKKRISLAFSDKGQILLHLDSPRSFRLGLRKQYIVDELLISVDQRDEFLCALKQ